MGRINRRARASVLMGAKCVYRSISSISYVRVFGYLIYSRQRDLDGRKTRARRLHDNLGKRGTCVEICQKPVEIK